MKRKNIILIIIGIFLIAGCYFGYKAFNLYYYKIDDAMITNNLTITDTLTINTEQLEQNQYLTFNNIKIRNDFQEFEILEDVSSEDTIKYSLYNEDNEVTSSFWITSENDYTYTEILKTDTTLFTTNNRKITTANLTDYLEKNKITNDIELLEYLANHKSTTNTIFTSVKKMKENYMLYFLSNIIIPETDGITLIDGDYTGYILNLTTSNAKEVSIIKEDKRYIFTFIHLDYFTDNYIKELLSTINIETTDTDTCTLVKTYNIKDITESNDEKYLYVTLTQFQTESEYIIKLSKENSQDLTVGLNYEFTFYIDKLYVEEAPDVIFENSELISIVYTDKVGLEQNNQYVCD